ncbi:MAG: UbiA family prenyltransferase [Verrucomicrobiaceae bacterium]|nr:UbiA family prenyltransferase [Verrucomicrobiaceae bacterium]
MSASQTSASYLRAGSPALLGTWLRALRWKQWVKNVLIFLPLLFSHKWGEGELVGQALLAFAVFCAGASAIYLINDLHDEAADREHPKKCLRPLAAGHLSRRSCWAASLGLLVAAGAAAVLLLPQAFG